MTHLRNNDGDEEDRRADEKSGKGYCAGFARRQFPTPQIAKRQRQHEDRDNVAPYRKAPPKYGERIRAPNISTVMMQKPLANAIATTMARGTVERIVAHDNLPIESRRFAPIEGYSSTKLRSLEGLSGISLVWRPDAVHRPARSPDLSYNWSPARPGKRLAPPCRWGCQFVPEDLPLRFCL